MKKIISVVCALVLVSVVAFAQDKKQKDPEKWREKVRAEQVAMITSELDLTEAEAQAFWPVYNEVQKQRREAFQASGEAFKALNEGVDGPDVNNLLNNYLDAKKKCEDLETEALIRYKKVLPVQKVAQLVMAEEKFRHQQIGKLGGKGNRPGPGPDGHRGGRMPQPPMGD